MLADLSSCRHAFQTHHHHQQQQQQRQQNTNLFFHDLKHAGGRLVFSVERNKPVLCPRSFRGRIVGLRKQTNQPPGELGLHHLTGGAPYVCFDDKRLYDFK